MVNVSNCREVQKVIFVLINKICTSHFVVALRPKLSECSRVSVASFLHLWEIKCSEYIKYLLMILPKYIE